VPELPDVTVYVEAIATRVVGQPLERADRSLSRVLHADWPRTAEELEERRGRP